MALKFRTKLYAIVAVNALILISLVAVSALIAGRVNDRLTEILDRTARGLQDAVAAADADQLAAAEQHHRAFLDDISGAAGGITVGQIAALRLAAEDYWMTAVDVSRRLIAGESGEAMLAPMRAM